MLLLNVLQGADTGGFILIQDTLKCSGRGLLRCFINAALKRNEDVHVVGFERPETEVCAGLDKGCSHKLHFHQAFPDPLGWTNRSSLTVHQFTPQHLTQLVKVSQKDKESVLVIDSLSFVLRHHEPVIVCKRLQELRKGGVIKTIIGLLHSDLHLHGVVGALCHLASTVISVAASNNEREAVAMTTRRTKSGKITQEEVNFTVSEDAILSVRAKLQHGNARTEDSAEEDPTSNLTFNLRLSEEEQKAKERVALPFVFSQEKKSSLLRPTPGSGKIVYEPDANDDFDEEDPDDDLDV